MNEQQKNCFEDNMKYDEKDKIYTTVEKGIFDQKKSITEKYQYAE